MPSRRSPEFKAIIILSDRNCPFALTNLTPSVKLMSQNAQSNPLILGMLSKASLPATFGKTMNHAYLISFWSGALLDQ
jgi:hypothetical protein